MDTNPCYTQPVSEENLSPARAGTPNQKETCKAIYNFFRDKGLTDASIKGILVNMMTESGLNYTVLAFDGNECKHSGIGGGLIGFYYNGAMQGLAEYYNRTTIIKNYNDEAIAFLRTNFSPCGTNKDQTPVFNAWANKGAVNLAVKNYFKTNNKPFPFTLDEQLRYVFVMVGKDKKKVSDMRYNDAREAADWYMHNIERNAHPAQKRYNMYIRTIENFLNS